NVTIPKEHDTVQKSYNYLAEQVKEKLGKIAPYFIKLADAMVTWIEAWDELNPSAAAAESGKAKQRPVTGGFCSP
ncbi:hypothetical protein, partial [Salmonella enterica]|uniref:hypothetical protein n=1 Tax=Salmonella enterica TaxID=28901 RepID=UPI001FACC103